MVANSHKPGSMIINQLFQATLQRINSQLDPTSSRNPFTLRFISLPDVTGVFCCQFCRNKRATRPLTTVRLRISSITRGQKDWRLCWASLLLAGPKPPSVDILAAGRDKTERQQRGRQEPRVSEATAKSQPK